MAGGKQQGAKCEHDNLERVREGLSEVIFKCPDCDKEIIVDKSLLII